MSLPDLYSQLFGRDKLRGGNVIDLAEHGRAGAVSDGQGFKFTKDVSEVTLVDEASDTVTYIGTAAPGTATSTTDWQIKRISVSGTVTTIAYANGSVEYDFEWDERSSYTYS